MSAPASSGLFAGLARLLTLSALAPAAVAQIFPGPPTSSPGPPGSLAPQTAACVRPLACFTVDDAPGMLPGTMQVVAFYDGTAGTTANFDVEMMDAATGACCDVRVTIPQSARVQAHEYRMLPGWEPTGRAVVSGVAPNGSIDGVAFSIYVRDHSGDRWLLQSAGDGLAVNTPNFMGAWPVAWTEAQWDTALALNGPCFTGTGVQESRRRRQAHGALTGAQMLPNGQHFTPRQPMALGDLNGDGCVDNADVTILTTSPGAKCANHIGNCPVVSVHPTFSSDRFSAFPPDRAQLVMFYDANVITFPSLTIEFRNPVTRECCDMQVTLPPFLAAFEFNLNGFEPTGRVTVVNNASGGRLGFAMYGREPQALGGDRWMMSSSALGVGATGGRQFLGIPPYEQTQAQWDHLLSQNGAPFWPPVNFDDFVLRRQAQATVSGAQLLPDGVYIIPNRRCIDADLNGDGMVDAADLNVLMANFGVGCCP